VATVRFYTRGVRAVHKTEHLSAAFGSIAPVTPTSRGPIVDEAALIETLKDQKIAGAGLDVFDQEPLPPSHPFRQLSSVLATPHLGYGIRSLYEIFYRDSVANIKEWILENS
jgi:phosphoglycerate dehydrogenase-like enzyme